MTIRNISDARRVHQGYFFEPDTIRFFLSSVHKDFYPSKDGMGSYFVTGEQRKGCVRRYTVRYIEVANGEISTVGEFQAYGSKRAAHRDARKFASEGYPTDS